MLLIWAGSRPDLSKIATLHRTHRALFYSTLVFLLSATVGLFIANDFLTAAGLWKAYFVEPLLFFIILITSLKREHIGRYIGALSIAAGLVSLNAVLQFYVWPGGIIIFGHIIGEIPNMFWRIEEGRRATSIFLFPNAIGLYLAPMIPFFIYAITKLWKQRLSRVKESIIKIVWYITVIILSIWAILLANSAGAIAALIGTLVAFSLAYKSTRIATVVLVVAAAIIIPATPLKDPFTQEVLMQNQSGQIRLQMWKETLEQLETQPILGNGLGSYQEAVQPFHKFDWVEIYLYPHNVLLNFWTEIGIVGAVAFLIIVLQGFTAALQKSNRLKITVAAALLIILIHGLVDVPYLKNDIAMFFWFIIALGVIAHKK